MPPAPIPLALEERTLRHAPRLDPPCSLLSELQSRAPAPNAYHGQCRRLGIRPGFDLTLYDFTMTHGFPEGGFMAPGLTVTLLLSGSGHGYLAQPGKAMSNVSIPYRGDNLYFCYGGVAVHGRSRLPPDAAFRAVELRLSLDFLDGIGLRDAFRTAGDAHPLCHVADDQVWVGLLRTPEPLADIATRLLRHGLDAEGDDLLTEKGALDILVGAMALMRDPPAERATPPRELARLELARRLVLAAPEEAWTIRALSRRAGLNERKLKEGFRAHLGTTVNAFVQQARLQKARALLAERRLSVTEVALAVGYANPSHFALMFRRRYGMPPSEAVGRAMP
ncbi:AraC family transcriptional regulator [Roseomonas sp. 18066]|uniref:helix-turn-helix transcriptional regulator n=1 Tax=Roseomonas sp. 18066 TaxID=2681412 RepID=UPI00135872A5|nr:AraC family transcriptional regulator [Roseomonas sp. 18066]